MSASTIRAVQEFFCPHGRCREVTLADGPRHPVLLSVGQLGAVAAQGGGRPAVPALWIKYRGQREDLIALGCVRRESLPGRRWGLRAADAPGGSLPAQSKPVPGHRGMIEVSYVARSRACARRLPGVRAYCGDWLEHMEAPPLRLVIDNTRRKLSSQPASSTARLAGA